MKVAILCGGKGTRLREYTEDVPKPLVEIGGIPILMHIMKIYAHYGHKEFILLLGYKGQSIKDYFSKHPVKEWSIVFLDTGEESSKGKRVKMLEPFVKEENFFLAYGDDVADIKLDKLLEYHLQKGKIVTLTAINPISQFGILELDDGVIKEFQEKPKLDHWINGGFFVFNKKIFSYLKEGLDLEEDVFPLLVKEKQICAFKHHGFWECMNTFKDTVELNEMWKKDKAPWKV